MMVAKQRLAVYIAGVGVLGLLLLGGTIRAQRSGRIAEGPLPKVLGAYQLGEQFRNKLDLRLRLQMSRATEQELHLTGDLSRTPVDIHDQFVEVAYEVQNAQVSLKGADPASGNEQQRAEQNLAAGLSHRFYVRHRSDGAVLALQFERGLNPAFANILLTMVGTAQLVQGNADQSTWTAVEKDANGDYLAAYVRTGAHRVTKRKLRYLNEGQAQGAPVAASSISITPHASIELAAFDLVESEHGRLKEVQGSERIKVALGALGLSLSTTVTLNLSACTIQKNPEMVGDYGLQKDNYILQPMETAAEDPRIRRAYEDRSVLNGATLSQVWTELSALSKPIDSNQTSGVVRRLEAVFRLEESSIADALRRLPGIAEANGKLAVDALSLAQTDAAQDALAAIARGAGYSKLQREYAILYLGHQQAPSAPCLSALQGLIDNKEPKRRQLARLAYGTLAARVASKQAEQARQMVQALIDRLQTTSDDSERADLYLALGNSAASSVFLPLREATLKNKGVLRATAIEALGHVDDPAVVPLLSELLKSEQLEVRMAALNGVQRRELGPFLPALVEMVKHDKSAYVRSAAVELLGSQLASVPQLRDVLTECSSKDPEAKVRNAAVRQLNQRAAQSTG